MCLRIFVQENRIGRNKSTLQTAFILNFEMGGCGTSRCLISYITMNLKPIHNQYFCWHLWNFKLSQSYRACIDPFLFYTNDVNKTRSIDELNALQVPALWFRNCMVESDTHYHFTQDQLLVLHHLHKHEKGTRLKCRRVLKKKKNHKQMEHTD